MKKGNQLVVELEHISDGRGVAKGEDDKLILVEGVTYNDLEVKVEITNVLEETIITKKISGVGSSETIEEQEGPYQIDNENDEE